MARFDYLIVGGGMTADAAARGIRELDSAATVGIIASEPDAPYSRPPLSKALWKGEAEDSVWHETSELCLTLQLGRTVTAVDPVSRVVTDDHGQRHEYGSLLLATGGSPRTLPFPADGVVYFRTFRDYRTLRALTENNQRFAVLGGGFIGSEIAAALRMNDREVVMIVPEKGIGARVFPADLSTFVTDYYRQKGIDVRPQTLASSVQRRSDAYTIGVGGDALTVGGIVAALGIVPNVELARAMGIDVTDGIDVNEHLRTSVDGVYAAGDVARFQNQARRASARRARGQCLDNGTCRRPRDGG